MLVGLSQANASVNVPSVWGQQTSAMLSGLSRQANTASQPIPQPPPPSTIHLAHASAGAQVVRALRLDAPAQRRPPAPPACLGNHPVQHLAREGVQQWLSWMHSVLVCPAGRLPGLLATPCRVRLTQPTAPPPRPHSPRHRWRHHRRGRRAHVRLELPAAAGCGTAPRSQ